MYGFPPIEYKNNDKIHVKTHEKTDKSRGYVSKANNRYINIRQILYKKKHKPNIIYREEDDDVEVTHNV
jgi:hypothetical protein